jgi:hypothetical protein
MIVTSVLMQEGAKQSLPSRRRTRNRSLMSTRRASGIVGMMIWSFDCDCPMSSDAHEEPQRVEEAERQHMGYRDEQNAECTSTRSKGTGGELNYCRQRMRYCDGQNVEYMSTRDSRGCGELY